MYSEHQKISQWLPADVTTARPQIVTIMSSAATLKVPLLVDVATGLNWVKPPESGQN